MDKLSGPMLGTEGTLVCMSVSTQTWTDNTPGFGIIVGVTHRLSAVVFCKLLVPQESKSTTPKLFS